MEQPIRTVEKGVRYKTSRIAYIANYFIVILLIAFLFLLSQKFKLNFNLAAASVEELIPVLTFLAFAIVAVYLAEEVDIERIIRQYVVTNNEIIKIEGVIRKKRIAIPYQSVADIKVIRGVIGRIFNFGNVEITGMKNNIIMKGIKDPEEIYRIIQNKISRFRVWSKSRKIQIEREEE
jgi:membrane protein YdbS with pleckstrin-like domain